MLFYEGKRWKYGILLKKTKEGRLFGTNDFDLLSISVAGTMGIFSIRDFFQDYSRNQ